VKLYIDELTIEAIKLIELLSSLNLEDFQMNQWIFLVDGIGMKQTNLINRKNSTNYELNNSLINADDLKE